MKIANIYTAAGKLGEGIARIFSQEIGEFEHVQIVDDTLIFDMVEAGGMTPEIHTRVMDCFDRAAAANPDLIVCTCSSIGDATEEAQASGKYSVPVLRIDQAMAEEAVQTGKNIAVMATLPTTLDPTCDLIKRCAKAAGKEINITPILLNDFVPLMKAGKVDEAVASVLVEAEKLQDGHDVIVMAQASLGMQKDRIQPSISIPVLSSPPLCAKQIKSDFMKGANA